MKVESNASMEQGVSVLDMVLLRESAFLLHLKANGFPAKTLRIGLGLAAVLPNVFKK